MKLPVKSLLKITNGKLIKGNNLSEGFLISTDTRKITSSDFFLPLIGPNFNGHDYIDQAINRNCRGYFIDKEHDPVNISVDYIISVENTLNAYLDIANYVRKKINPVVIGVTGSSGKTSTKELIASVLSIGFTTHKSILNHNNEIGLCQTILSMPEDTRYAVIEMGMRSDFS